MDQSGSIYNDNEGVLHIPKAPGVQPEHQMQLSVISKTFVVGWRSYTSGEIQLAYSTASADRKKISGLNIKVDRQTVVITVYSYHTSFWRIIVQWYVVPNMVSTYWVWMIRLWESSRWKNVIFIEIKDVANKKLMGNEEQRVLSARVMVLFHSQH